MLAKQGELVKASNASIKMRHAKVCYDYFIQSSARAQL